MNNPSLLQEGRLLDYTIVFLVAKRLVKPIKKWEAYKLGIIDEDGLKIRDPETSDEKNAYTILDKLILKVKHLIGHHKLRVITSILLLKEQTNIELSEEELIEHYQNIQKSKNLYEELKDKIHNNGMTVDEFWNFLLQEKLED